MGQESSRDLRVILLQNPHERLSEPRFYDRIAGARGPESSIESKPARGVVLGSRIRCQHETERTERETGLEIEDIHLFTRSLVIRMVFFSLRSHFLHEIAIMCPVYSAVLGQSVDLRMAVKSPLVRRFIFLDSQRMSLRIRILSYAGHLPRHLQSGPSARNPELVGRNFLRDVDRSIPSHTGQLIAEIVVSSLEPARQMHYCPSLCVKCGIAGIHVYHFGTLDH